MPKVPVEHRMPHTVPNPASGRWSDGRGLAWQLAAMLLAPIAFLLHLQIGYAAVPWACIHGNTAGFHAAALGSVLLAAAGTYAAWRLWRSEAHDARDDEPPPLSRVRFVAITGGVSSATFLVVLLVQWAPAFVLSPCQ